MNSISCPRWIGRKPDGLRTFNFKKDVPAEIKHLTLVRVDFGIYGIAYVATDFHGDVVCAIGNAPIHRAILTSRGAVIGLRDLSAADGQPWAHEWRASMDAAICARIGLPVV